MRKLEGDFYHKTKTDDLIFNRSGANRMKILIVNSLYPPYVIGGAEISSQKLAEELAKAGHEVAVLATGESDNYEQANNVKIYRRRFTNIMSFWEFKRSTPGKRLTYKLLDLYNPFNKKAIMEVLRLVNPDVIHTNTIYGITPAIWDCASSLRIPVVQTLRDYYLMCPKANLMPGKGGKCENPNIACKVFRTFHKRKSLKVSAVTAPSEFTLNRFLDDGYFENSIKQVVYNAIDYDADRFAELAELKMSMQNETMHVAYIGSFIETKGIQILLKAIEQCNGKMMFHFAGKGRLLPEIQKAAEKNGNIVIEGFLSEDKLNELMEKMDMLVCPSIWDEPFGRVIIDAYKSCVPVIGTNCGGIPELIENGVTGLIIEKNSVDSLVQALTYMDEHKLTREMVNAMEKKLRQFSLLSQREQFEKIYNKIRGGGIS